MKRDFTLFCRIWIGIPLFSGLVTGFSMSPPALDDTRDQIVLDANDTLTITCRGQRILDWSWPEESLSKVDFTDRQEQQPPADTPGDRAVRVKECQGEAGKPYCKTLILPNSEADDSGYYRCFYQDIRAVIDGTTAASIYVFVRDPNHPFIRTNENSMETIFITDSQTHIEVPCLVSDPELKVSLFSQLESSPVLLEGDDITWNNKRGWSVPRHILKNTSIFIGFFCSISVQNKDYRSSMYLVQATGFKFYELKLFPEDSPVELMQGEVLVLNCTALVEFNAAVEFKWDYPGQKEKRLASFQPVRNVLEKNTMVSSILTIRNVHVGDTGYYTCSAGSVEITRDLTTVVIVHEKPFISLDYRNGSVIEAKDGQISVRLSVKLSAYPLPETQWYKNGKFISRRPEFSRFKVLHQALEIRDMCKQDAGEYTVIVKNTAASLEKRLNFTLIVNVPPQIHEKEAAAPTNPYRKSSRQTLTCTATGNPPATITWQWRPWSPCGLNSTRRTLGRRGQRDKIPVCQDWIDLDPDHTVNPIESIETLTEMVDGKEKAVGRVVIQNANVSAMYKCSAENKVGKDERLIYFYVTTIPEGFGIEMEPSEEPLEKDMVRLKCNADNYTYENLQWYRLDPQAVPPELDCKSLHQYAESLGGKLSFQTSSNNWVLELAIANIQLQDEGNYVCEVQNRRSGEKHCHRKYIPVKALEAPRYRHNPTNQTVNVSESLQMECDVEGTPSPQLSWSKDNQPLQHISGILLQDSNRTLSIQRVREEDAGLYTCTACNQRGCVQSSATVSVIGSDDRTSVEIVILIGTGVIAIFFWVLLLVIFCNVKRVNPADIKTGYLSIIMDPGEVPLEDQCEYLPYDSSQWERPRDRLCLGKVLGHGAFGKVIEASISAHDKKTCSNTVAVKMLKEGATASEHKALMSELKILIHIGNHLNVVNLLGACTKPNGPLMVIVEYCKYGNLSNFLRAKREFFLPYRDRSPKTQSQMRRMIEAGQVDQRGHQPSTSSNITPPMQSRGKSSPSLEKLDDLWKTPLTIEDLICYSFQVARGMEFLVSRKCIHRDLAARNILLSENNVVKICDFGLARDIYKDPDYVRKGNARLPLKWMAPESIFDKVYTSQSDVWSFGVLLWEIFSLGASPYPGLQIDEDFCKRLKDGTRMRSPDNASPEIYGIMLACWQGEPRERPTFPALVEILGDLLQENSLPELPLNLSESSEDDGFSQASSRPPSQEEIRLACNTLSTGYYNCVPFAGCIMVGPSNTCHSRVKTFEELPLEITSHKTHHDSQTDSGMVLASDELERFEHKHRGILKNPSAGRSTERLISSPSVSSSGSISTLRPAFFSQLSGQTFYNNEYGQLSEEGVCDFFSSDQAVYDGAFLATSNL
ncbi:vascular endothelial growth factor receptor 3 isoform X1 [Triplophysa rosa]|uniref:Vascular endothelial growth factor receptor 3 n=1 Tax=Triplophysa rosa TaxID=992332 RepID=A0A9W7TLQ8_TRIRA|nr:vascular endothelial growth factor receptor 3 isoform X1 [Triplophysa rosa]KAI7801265.1 putative vascular endothelial growth factor receptor 3 [Triplophysa rosa]